MENPHKKVEQIYDSRRGWTDVAQNVAAFGLLGSFRKRSARSLGLKKGDIVLDLCCGAGGNLKYLHDLVGDEGKIFGWDLSAGMLAIAQQKVEDAGWKNVCLVRGNAEQIGLLPKFDAVISTYSMSIVPNHRAVQAAAAQVLKPGGKLVIFDRHLKSGGFFRRTLNRAINKNSTRWHADWTRKPWEDLGSYFKHVEMHEVMFGLYYIAWGVKG